LEDGTRGVSEGGEEGCEEASETVGRRGCWVGGFCVEKPLDDGDAMICVSFEIRRSGANVEIPYCTIEAAGTKSETLPDILEEEISFNLSLQSNLFNESDLTVIYPFPSAKKKKVKLTQHTRSDVDTGPDITFIIEDLTRETGPTPDVEQECGLIRWHVK